MEYRNLKDGDRVAESDEILISGKWTRLYDDFGKKYNSDWMPPMRRPLKKRVSISGEGKRYRLRLKPAAPWKDQETFDPVFAVGDMLGKWHFRKGALPVNGMVALILYGPVPDGTDRLLLLQQVLRKDPFGKLGAMPDWLRKNLDDYYVTVSHMSKTEMEYVSPEDDDMGVEP